MLIPQSKIEEVLARADIAAVVGRHVALKKSGRELKACCPFHSEKTPSFYVNPDKRMWWCFGCGTGGNVFSFLMRMQGMGFLDAVRELAREVSVDLAGAEDPREKERAQLRQVSELAARHFRDNLLDPQRGAVPRRYLAERGLADETVQKFGLGWAPNTWNDLCDRIVKEGALEPAQRAGLLSKKHETDRYYDFFRGRLMIPIRSPEGRTIAFGGRILEGDQPQKYLNSRESPLYLKAEVLYGLDLAREPIRRSGVAVLVEGYFDAIGLHQAGIANAVALCSTTLTGKQLDLLARHGAKALVLLLDGDAAGVKAVERLAAPILAHGTTARVAVLPEGQDPDEFIEKSGVAAMNDLIAQAKPLTEHLLSRALPEGDAAPWEAKVAALKQLRPALEGMGPSLERSMFVGRLASYLGVTEAEVKQAVGSGLAPQPRAPAPVEVPSPAPTREIAVTASEELLCALLLADAGLAQAPGADALEELRHQGLRALVDEFQRGGELTELWGHVESGVARRIQRKRGEILTHWPNEANRREAVMHTARQIRLTRVEERLIELKKEFARLHSEDLQSDELRGLLDEQSHLRQLRTRLTAPPGPERSPDDPLPAAAAGAGRQGP